MSVRRSRGVDGAVAGLVAVAGFRDPDLKLSNVGLMDSSADTIVDLMSRVDCFDVDLANDGGGGQGGKVGFGLLRRAGRM